MDRAVQKTDDDAASSKHSAMTKGYFADAYLPLFVRAPPPRLPLINIGTYCRVQGIERLVDRFLYATRDAPRRAIVSLGAGSDTRPFHVLRAHANVEYHELDFVARTTKKLAAIRAHAALRDALALAPADPRLDSAPAELHTDAYHLYGIDLRTLAQRDAQRDATPPAALQALVAAQIPTLLLSECCLCYLSPHDSDGVLRFFAESLPQPLLSVAMYEPMALDDEFGRVMAENLAMRGLSLPTFRLFSTAAAHADRLARIVGAPDTGAVSIETVYDEWLDPADFTRVSRLEFLDEVEEMRLLMRHYCIAWATGSATT